MTNPFTLMLCHAFIHFMEKIHNWGWVKENSRVTLLESTYLSLNIEQQYGLYCCLIVCLILIVSFSSFSLFKSLGFNIACLPSAPIYMYRQQCGNFRIHFPFKPNRLVCFYINTLSAHWIDVPRSIKMNERSEPLLRR